MVFDFEFLFTVAAVLAAAFGLMLRLRRHLWPARRDGGCCGCGNECSRPRRAAPARLLPPAALVRRRVSGVGVAVIGFALAWSGSGRATDTVETFELGLGEFEMYQSFAGLGLPLSEQSRTTDALLGYGVTPRLSFYAAPSFSVSGYLSDALLGFELGAFGTPIDTDHFDLDLGVAAATDGEVAGHSNFVELNLDIEPDLSLAGVYVRAGLALVGGEDDAGRSLIALESGVALGAYVTLADRHQLLGEMDCGWVESPLGRTEWQHGALRLGYNVRVLDHVELLHEISFDVPNQGEIWGIGVSLGVIATLPPHEFRGTRAIGN